MPGDVLGSDARALISAGDEEGTIRVRRTLIPVGLTLVLFLLSAAVGCSAPPAVPLAAAVVTTSSDTGRTAVRTADVAADGSVSTEWSEVGGPGSWIQLTWPTPQPLGAVVLRDRDEPRRGIADGTLTFDDGSAVQVANLPEDASPLAVPLARRASTTVRLTVTTVAAGTRSAGPAELVVRPSTSEVASTARAATSPPDVPCPAGHVLNVVAHPDDDLFFLSPHVQRRLGSGACLRTIVLTAGDDGLDVEYWRSREEGLRAAYATTAKVANAWTTTRVNLNGYFVDVDVLTADPRVSLVFLRLPEGNLLGEGFPATGEVSLSRLWSGRTAAMTALDGRLTLTTDQLVRLLRALIVTTGPTEINTLDPRPGRIDHDDHQFTARYALQAAAGLQGEPRPTSYEGYTISSRPANVSGADLAAKKAAFYAYAPFDKNICQTEVTCYTAPNGPWLAREYQVPR